MKRAFLVFVPVAAVAACSSASTVPGPSENGEAVDVTREAVGEQQNGFPSPWERALFMAANRARSDPSTVKGTGSTVYPAVKPLVQQYDLERSSRFHSTNLQLTDVTLMHESPCTLNTDVGTSGCSGDPACACAMPVPSTCTACANVPATNNGCGTDPFTRIHYIYKAANAEVAAAGYGDPWSTMSGWVDEATGADGHRTIIDSVGSDESVAGFGHAAMATGVAACFKTFDVGDFGPTTTPAPTIASAAPMPISGNAGSFTIYATWNDPAGGAPADLNAVVDAACTPMTLELGDPKLNATYKATVTLTAGCHSVYIVGDTAGGVRSTYPTTTAFTIPVGSGACADEVAQPVAHCSGVDGGVGGADAGNLDASTTGLPIDSGGGTTAGDAGKATGGDSGTTMTGGGVTSDSGTSGGGGTDTGTGPVSTADGGASGGGTGGAHGADAGSVSSGGGDAAAGGGSASSSSGCSFAAAPVSGTTGAWSALAALGLVLPLRRRGRARRARRTHD